MIAMLAAAAAFALQPASPDVDQLAWMSGTWEEQRNSGPHQIDWTVETWLEPRGGTMLGTSLSGFRAGDILTGRPVDFAQGFEFMRIARGTDGVLSFHGSPEGAPAVAFRLVRTGAGEAVFENPSHDYPQRITYRREANMLTATISLIDGSRERRWTYFRR